LVKLQYFATIAAAPAVTPLILVSITVATLSFVYQTDYKKLIAYATVQEMNILTLLYLLTAQSGPDVVAALLIVHTLLSGLFFTIADLLYKKYNTRALTALKGLLLVAPKLSTLIIIAVLVFKGLPYTAKFPIEFTLYSLLMQSNALLAVFLLALLVFFGNLIFTIINMAILFGTPKQGSAITDLTTKELGLIIIPLAWLVGLVI
jgi:formate hydrogenlyase subunit 3/multisubunit Na+/H+ antiporter MnhD subunit